VESVVRTFEVLLERRVAYEAAVTIEARSEKEAANLAVQRAKDDMIAWTQVDDDVREQVVPCPR
jgi:hypothetical protein